MADLDMEALDKAEQAFSLFYHGDEFAQRNERWQIAFGAAIRAYLTALPKDGLAGRLDGWISSLRDPLWFDQNGDCILEAGASEQLIADLREAAAALTPVPGDGEINRNTLRDELHKIAGCHRHSHRADRLVDWAVGLIRRERSALQSAGYTITKRNDRDGPPRPSSPPDHTPYG